MAPYLWILIGYTALIPMFWLFVARVWPKDTSLHVLLFGAVCWPVTIMFVVVGLNILLVLSLVTWLDKHLSR